MQQNMLLSYSKDYYLEWKIAIPPFLTALEKKPHTSLHSFELTEI